MSETKTETKIEQMGEIFNPKIRDEPMDIKLFNKLLKKREKQRAYGKAYYQKHKDKYTAKGERKGKVGKRGKCNKMKYTVTVLGEEGHPMMWQNYKTLDEIALSLNLSIMIVRKIYHGKYLNAKQKRTKKYLKYRIERIDKAIKRL